MKRTRRVIQDAFPEGSIPRVELREAFRELREHRLADAGRNGEARSEPERVSSRRVRPLVRRMKVAQERAIPD